MAGEVVMKRQVCRCVFSHSSSSLLSICHGIMQQKALGDANLSISGFPASRTQGNKFPFITNEPVSQWYSVATVLRRLSQQINQRQSPGPLLSALGSLYLVFQTGEKFSWVSWLCCRVSLLHQLIPHLLGLPSYYLKLEYSPPYCII